MRDIYAMYERSTQSPEADAAFIAGVYRRRFGREPRTLREDFCGTAALSRAFVERGRRNEAVGIDLDRRLLERAPHHERLTFRKGDARRAAKKGERFEVIAAYNFSYFVFKKRRELLAYFTNVRASLSKRGLFFIDVFGGLTAEQPSIETRELPGFTYIWEQRSFDPLTRTLEAYIHFRLRDGSLIQRAFRYDWRLWQIIELTELLEDAGFGRSDVYWEDKDAKGRATHRFRRRTRVDAEPSWTAYLVSSIGSIAR